MTPGIPGEDEFRTTPFIEPIGDDPMPHLPVRQRRFTLASTTGGLLACASWVPENPRAYVLGVHGHAEHLGRYPLLINTLVSHGYAVSGLDHHGHGRSSGVRAFVPRFDAFVDDLERLGDVARAERPGLPLVVLGHSMGGLIAVRYALRHVSEIAALIVSGPALIIDEGVRNRDKRIGRLLAKIAPKAGIPRGDDDPLSWDPEVRRQFRIDHRCYNGPTRAATAVSMLDAATDARSRLGDLTMPLLAMHGADDRLTFPSGTKLLHERASSTDKTLRILPNHKHEIFNERDRHRTIADVLAWLEEHV